MDGRVNTCELSLNVVKIEEPKTLTGSTQKGKWPGTGAAFSPVMDEVPPAEREDLPHPVIQTEHGKPVILPRG